jgi:putative flavoprotein involved in K+ transport
LRLLTPNWLTALPGVEYGGDDPDGYMSSAEVAAFIGDYAIAVDAPVRSSTTVTRVTAREPGYEVETDQGCWRCAAVVIATGPCGSARLPQMAAELPAELAVETAMTYRSPAHLAPGRVLVVGASATGVQLADEIQRSGRPVTLAVGEHVRLPRTYRGRDIFWWTDAAGVLDERYDEVDDLVRARHVPSPQLIGSCGRRDVDINALAESGVEIVGRLGRVVDGTAQFSGSLPNVCALADLKLNRLLDRLDAWADTTGADVGPPHRSAPTAAPTPSLAMDLRRNDVGTVLFATGYRTEYPWLDLPALDGKRRIVHDGGVLPGAPGCYVIGLPLLRRRRSSYINGSLADSADIAGFVAAHLDRLARTSGTSCAVC